MIPRSVWMKNVSLMPEIPLSSLWKKYHRYPHATNVIRDLQRFILSVFKVKGKGRSRVLDRRTRFRFTSNLIGDLSWRPFNRNVWSDIPISIGRDNLHREGLSTGQGWWRKQEEVLREHREKEHSQWPSRLPGETDKKGTFPGIWTRINPADSIDMNILKAAWLGLCPLISSVSSNLLCKYENRSKLKGTRSTAAVFISTIKKGREKKQTCFSLFQRDIIRFVDSRVRNRERCDFIVSHIKHYHSYFRYFCFSDRNFFKFLRNI